MSNMQFVSKLVERVAADQLQSHLGKLLDWFASFFIKSLSECYS